MAINSTTYDYLVFYYDINTLVNLAELKSLYAQKLTADKGSEAAMTDEDSELIAYWLKQGADDAASKILAYVPDDVLGYEYGKQNIDPDSVLTGDYIVYRAYFDEDKLQEGILQKIDSAMTQYITAYVKAEFSQETGAEEWSKIQVMLEQANARLENAISFRKTPPVITQNNF